MSTTELRQTANRVNALKSTGPITIEGKAVASQNATRHGLLSSRLILEDEDQAAFEGMSRELCSALKPVGAAEAALVERIAITLWRQRRLVSAESAALDLARSEARVAAQVEAEFDRHPGGAVRAEHLRPFDAERLDWCRRALAELEWLDDDVQLAILEKGTPLVFEQLQSDAEEAGSVETLLEETTGGLASYLRELRRWCKDQLRQAERRPEVLAVAEKARRQRLVLKPDLLELLSRYQTSLDNQLFKTLKALREAQEWRVETLQIVPTETPAARA